ncbi:MAG: hypothetical protein ACRD4O_03035, partial [Bryobacteraceae bacterium]
PTWINVAYFSPYREAEATNNNKTVVKDNTRKRLLQEKSELQVDFCRSKPNGGPPDREAP